MSCLWMGDVDPYMDDKFILRAFATMGELVDSVRIIRNKINCAASGYCFVEMADEATAERCIRKINGKPLPGSMPPRRFKINRAIYGKHGDNRNKTGDSDVSSSQLYTYDHNQYHNQYYQQCSDYYSHWGNDQRVSYDYSSYEYCNQAYGDRSEDASEGLEDPSMDLDVVEANRQFMIHSEELYDALIECHWPASDFPDLTEWNNKQYTDSNQCTASLQQLQR